MTIQPALSHLLSPLTPSHSFSSQSPSIPILPHNLPVHRHRINPSTFTSASTPTSSSVSHPSTSPTLTTFDFPPEITRRIIAHALTLPPPHLLINLGDTPQANWDEIGGYGYAGHRAIVRRVKMRLRVAQDALSLMRVCKAWKVLATKYLYAEPHIHLNLNLISNSIINGDRKWSDLNLHPVSLPGRYITTLDLSHLDASIFGTHITSIAKHLSNIVPLLPNVQHLTLPPPRRGAGPLSLEQVRDAPFVKKLKSLEGVVDRAEDGYGNGRKVLLELLRRATELEVLAVVGSAIGVGEDDEDDDDDHQEGEGEEEDRSENDFRNRKQKERPLDLPNLHTLILEDVFPGLLTRILINSKLPSLRRLAISPIHDTFDPSNNDDDDDLNNTNNNNAHPHGNNHHTTLSNSHNDTTTTTYEALQSVHGHKILSLTYLHCNSTWCLPSIMTLELHPNLVHLHLALLNSTLQTYDWFPIALRDSSRTQDRHISGTRTPLSRSDSEQLSPTSLSTSMMNATLNGQTDTPVHKHPLHTISIPKWHQPCRQSPSPLPRPHPMNLITTNNTTNHNATQLEPNPSTPGGNKFLDSLLVAPPPNLKVIVVQGFSWVRPGLPLAAMNTGESGMMLAWSARLGLDGIELRDSEGRVAPEFPISEERGRGKTGNGGTGRRRSGEMVRGR